MRVRPQVKPQTAGTISKAAIIMMAIDDVHSQRLLAGLDEEEVRLLGGAMAKLGRTAVDQVEKTVDEFRSQMGHTTTVNGNWETTEKMLLRSMTPEKVAEIMEGIRAPNGRNIWDKIANLQPQTLAGYLRAEYPQTVSVILSKLPAPTAAKVLRLLPEPLAADVSIRLVRIDNIQRSVLIDIEDTLKREFVSELSRSHESDSAAVMAEMLNRSEKDVLDRIMAALEEAEPQAAARIRRMMFTFEDLQRVEKSTFGTLISECPIEKLPVALANASSELLELFLTNMSARAANMLREEMEAMTPPRRKLIEEAQAEIVALAKRLRDEQRIVINEEEEGEEPML